MKQDDLDALRARLEQAFRGHPSAVAAVALFMDFFVLTQVWDDLVDRDRPLTADQINDAFWIALVKIPGSPLYLSHGAAVRATMQNAILAWLQSNLIEASRQGRSGEEIVAGHVIRYQLVDLLSLLLSEFFGWQYAAERALEIRELMRHETLMEFAGEKHGMGSEGAAA
ncbi:MAG: hypothetical protein ACK5XA_15745 [Tagaea sp.]|jgi:hypothetical protein